MWKKEQRELIEKCDKTIGKERLIKTCLVKRFDYKLEILPKPMERFAHFSKFTGGLFM